MLLPLIVSATSAAITDPENVCVSCVGSNAYPQGPENPTVIAGPVHAIDTLATSASGTTPLPPPSTMHVCCRGLVATVTVYEAPGANCGGKWNTPFADTVSRVSTPSATSRSDTPSAPSHSPRTRPVTWRPWVTSGMPSSWLHAVPNPHTTIAPRARCHMARR